MRFIRFLVLSIGALLVVALGAKVVARMLPVQEVTLTQAAPDDDPSAPIGGNPKGHLTIVAFVDYNCPYCKTSAAALADLVASDRDIRLVYKDWPIVAATSTYGAKLALGAKYQGKYEAVHNALMALQGPGDRDRMDDAVRGAGVDIDRLNKDLDVHFDEIVATIRHNDAEAKALGLRGTPAYFIGPYEVIAAPDEDGFKKIVAAARAQK